MSEQSIDHAAVVEQPKFRIGHVVRTTTGEQTIYDVEPAAADGAVRFLRDDGQYVSFNPRYIVSVERFLVPIKEKKRGAVPAFERASE